jgi:DNA polymerase V
MGVRSPKQWLRLGIYHGRPWFKIRHLVESDELVAVTELCALRHSSVHDDEPGRWSGARAEIYSIDESFIDLTGVRGNLVERSFRSARILQWVGISLLHWHCIHARHWPTPNHVAKTAERKPGIYPTS